MHSKIYKARLINIHSDSNGENVNDKILQSPTIHAYYGMLQHVFQRNRHMIKELKLSGVKLEQTQEVKKKSVKRAEELSVDFRNKAIKYKGQRSLSVKKGERVEPSKLQAIQVKRSEINLENSLTCFMPIGQAFQNRQTHKTNRYNPEKRNQRGLILRKNILSPSERRYPSNRESYTQRDSLLLRKRLATEGKKSFIKMKSQGCEETNHSSIRNSQKSNPEPQNAPLIQQDYVSEFVSPW